MLISSFLDYLYLEKNYSKRTVTAYKADLNSFYNFCECELDCKDLKQVNYHQIRTWIVSLVDSGLANRSVNRKLSSLKSFYKFLLKTNQIKETPLKKHKSLKEDKKVHVPFTEHEVQKAISLINEEEDVFVRETHKLIFEILFTTGIRRSELIDLKNSSFDFGNQALKVLGKRNNERLIPLAKVTSQKIQSYIELKSDLGFSNSMSLLLNSKGGKLNETLVYSVINNYLRNVSSKEKKSPHMIRHSFATHLLNEGADINSVKELLGHSSLASTQVYTHANLGQLKKVYNLAHPKSNKNKHE